jgi:hypothetical protein
MNKLFAFAFIIISALPFVACKKTSEVDKASLVARTWFVVDGRFGTEKPAPGQLEGIMFSLTSDGKYQVANPNMVPVVPTRSPSNMGTWALSANGNMIIFDSKSAQENSVNIVSLNGNRMEIEWREEKPGKVATTYALSLQAR